MDDIRFKPICTFTVNFRLTEEEARALSALSAYNISDVLKVISEKISPSMVEDHKRGFISFFESVRQNISSQLKIIDESWRLLKTIK